MRTRSGVKGSSNKDKNVMSRGKDSTTSNLNIAGKEVHSTNEGNMEVDKSGVSDSTQSNVGVQHNDAVNVMSANEGTIGHSTINDKDGGKDTSHSNGESPVLHNEVNVASPNDDNMHVMAYNEGVNRGSAGDNQPVNDVNDKGPQSAPTTTKGAGVDVDLDKPSSFEAKGTNGAELDKSSACEMNGTNAHNTVSNSISFADMVKESSGKKPRGMDGKLKKIDRIMANIECTDGFVGVHAIFQPYRISDHSPAILTIPSSHKFNPRPFKFYNILVQNPNFKTKVKECWNVDVSGFNMYKVVCKLKSLKKPLRKLLFNEGNIHEQVVKLLASYVHGYENYVIILEWIEVMGFVANSSPRITHLGSLKPAELENSPPAGVNRGSAGDNQPVNDVNDKGPQSAPTTTKGAGVDVDLDKPSSFEAKGTNGAELDKSSACEMNGTNAHNTVSNSISFADMVKESSGKKVVKVSELRNSERVAGTNGLCKKVFRNWEWTSNGHLCSKGSRIIIGWNQDDVDFTVIAMDDQPYLLHLRQSRQQKHRDYYR
ncbi:RNA-directed DNA polymerase, eukaryota, Reverse transcriptase zinc-binding domain protein [Artemisia annua]|uniref:RNA-directed DNA polymerase, eukaryota, Reverse transcriptase zinc-binding domain protein n=1 Tax=Artemisia annua TaxID=35608 RepID=A0A2U1NMA4_ARTAN|nr:RNA-directed DNA polymerase, eukaryota, Reverse transcriptase zinc-binding domain protein [Artemisia annua]